MNKILILAACLIAQSTYAADARDFNSAGLSKVSVGNYSGDVTISAVDGDKATVTVTKNSMPDMCKVNAERSGSKLHIDVKRKGDAQCQVDMDIKIPKMVNLDLEVGTGKVVTMGTHGKLDFKVGAGSLTADGVYSEVDGKSGAGNIAIKGVTGSTEVKSGSGNINLVYQSLPEKGKIELKNGSGNSMVLLPKGSKFRAKIMAMTGQMENEFGNTNESNFTVEAKSGSGELKVKSY